MSFMPCTVVCFAHVSFSMAICYISADDEMFIIVLVCMRIYFIPVSVYMMKKLWDNSYTVCGVHSV